MKTILPRLLLALSLAAAIDAASLAADGEKWERVFNGKNLDGWTVKCKSKDREKEFWKVEDETIVANSLEDTDHDYVWLMTVKEYGDFEIKLKVQGFRQSPGNSGVQIRSRYDDEAGWLDGPQIDIHPPGPWRTGFIWDETRGNQRWIYPPGPRRPSDAKPSMAPPNHKWLYAREADGVDAWNDLHIICRGAHIKAILNGVVVTDYQGAGVLDDEIHQKRKVGMRGHIALQLHNGDRLKIRFKDLSIREFD